MSTIAESTNFMLSEKNYTIRFIEELVDRYGEKNWLRALEQQWINDLKLNGVIIRRKERI